MQKSPTSDSDSSRGGGGGGGARRKNTGRLLTWQGADSNKTGLSTSLFKSIATHCWRLQWRQGSWETVPVSDYYSNQYHPVMYPFCSLQWHQTDALHMQPSLHKFDWMFFFVACVCLQNPPAFIAFKWGQFVKMFADPPHLMHLKVECSSLTVAQPPTSTDRWSCMWTERALINPLACTTTYLQ